jgi:hypothetical protein
MLTSVELSDVNTNGTIATVTTDANGYYEISDVQPGTYIIYVFIPEAEIAACPNARRTNNDKTWSTAFQFTVQGAWIPMVSSDQFSVRLGDVIEMTPPLVCK